MESENFQEETTIEVKKDHLAPLKCVTPVSKYLALSLFIILPFLGGWIGYVNAPEKVVEVERVVVKEVEKEEEILYPDSVTIQDGGKRVALQNGQTKNIFPVEEGFVIGKVIASHNNKYIYFEESKPAISSHGGRWLYVFDVMNSSYHPLEFVGDEEMYKQIDLLESLFDLHYMVQTSTVSGWSLDPDNNVRLQYKIESGHNNNHNGVGAVLYYESISTTTPWIVSPKKT